MYIITRSTQASQQPPKTYHKFAMDFTNMPAIGMTAEQLALRVLSASKPPVDNEKTVLEQRGFRVGFAGKDNFDMTWQCQIYDLVDNITLAGLKTWKRLASDIITGGSTDPNAYKATAILYDLSYSNASIIGATQTLYGVYLSGFQAGGQYGNDVSPQYWTATFHYDYWV